VHHVQESSGFARLVVESADDRTEVDLAADARLFAERGRLATMLTGEELAVEQSCSPCSVGLKHETSWT